LVHKQCDKQLGVRSARKDEEVSNITKIGLQKTREKQMKNLRTPIKKRLQDALRPLGGRHHRLIWQGTGRREETALHGHLSSRVEERAGSKSNREGPKKGHVSRQKGVKLVNRAGEKKTQLGV